MGQSIIKSVRKIFSQSGGAGGVTGSGTTNYVAKFTEAGVVGNSQIFDNGTGVSIGTATPIASTLLTLKGTTSAATNFVAKLVNSSDETILFLENDKKAIFGGEIYTDNNKSIYAKNSSGTYEQFLVGRSLTDNITALTYGAGGFILRDKDLNSSLWVTDGNIFGFGYSYAETTYMTSKYNFKVSSADADGIRFQNTGATDGVGAFVLVAGGSNGFGISGWANSTILENGNTGSLVLGSYLSDIKFQTGARVTNMNLKSTGVFNITTQTYADNAAALAGGLVAKDIYKTATGELRIVV